MVPVDALASIPDIDNATEDVTGALNALGGARAVLTTVTSGRAPFVTATAGDLVYNSPSRECFRDIRACRQLSQIVAAARWTAARKFILVLS